MFQLTGGGFVEELRRRRNKVAAAPNAGIVIWAPDSLRWWVFQEFGTATHIGGEKYPIVPVNADQLSWSEPNAQGGRRYAKSVMHPGVPPTGMVRRVLGEIETYAAAAVTNTLFASDYDMAKVQQALIDEIGPAIKKTIVESIAQQLPGTRPDGRLEGATAAEVFDAETEIRPLA